MEKNEVIVNTQLIRAFINYNRAYDELSAKDGQAAEEKNFSELGDSLEILATEEILRGIPEAQNNRELAKEIIFDILDAEPLKALSAEELSIEFLNYFAGEFEARSNG